jgi:hypothetical protein
MSLASSGGYTVDGSPSTVVPANCSIARAVSMVGKYRQVLKSI